MDRERLTEVLTHAEQISRELFRETTRLATAGMARIEDVSRLGLMAQTLQEVVAGVVVKS